MILWVSSRLLSLLRTTVHIVELVRSKTLYITWPRHSSTTPLVHSCSFESHTFTWCDSVNEVVVELFRNTYGHNSDVYKDELLSSDGTRCQLCLDRCLCCLNAGVVNAWPLTRKKKLVQMNPQSPWDDCPVSAFLAKASLIQKSRKGRTIDLLKFFR